MTDEKNGPLELRETDAILVVTEGGEIQTWIPGDREEDSVVPGHALLIAQMAIAIQVAPKEFLDLLQKIWEEAEEKYNASIRQAESPDREGQSEDQPE
jgi:hypothetical protein